MADENPIARKLVKGSSRLGPVLPSTFNRVPVQRSTYPDLGEEIIEPSTRRRFLQGIPITQQTISSLPELDLTLRTNIERQLHQEDIEQNKRTATNDGAPWEIPLLIDRLDPLYRFSRIDSWHPTIIADRAGYFPEGFIDNLSALLDKKDRANAVCKYVRENVIQRLQGSDDGQIPGNQNYNRFYEQLAKICKSDIVDPTCAIVRDLAQSYLSQGYKIELIAEGRSRGGDYDGPLLGDNLSGSVTSFCLQTPLAIDDCSVEDLISNITTGIEVATATPVYQLYVDPSDDRTLRFPPNTNLTDWPGKNYQGFSDYWDTVLDHEKNLQIDNKTTYYGNLSSKNKGGFPRYGGLSIPTYQASSFVSLFNSLSAEERIYPHLVEMLGQDITPGEGNELEPNRSILQPYEINFQYYSNARGWVENTRLDVAIRQTGLSEHLRHLQGLAGESPDIFDVVEDEIPEDEQGIGFDLPDLGLGLDLAGLDNTPVDDCPPFADRLRAMLAAEANVNLEEDVIDAQLNSPRGLFLGMIGGDLEYTEPLFYKVTRDRLVGQDIERGTTGHLMTKNGLPVLGGQPIFHANKAENSYFTLEDRFVDYGDSYQYNVEAYTVVMKINYETNQVTREQANCFPNVDVNRIEQKLGEGVTYSLAIFKPKFDIIKVPYVHTDYQLDAVDVYDDRRLGVALPPITITDKPPIAPGMNIIPYRGMADKMLLMFDLQTDIYIEDYIYLSTEERRDFEAIHRRQKQQICDLCENSVEFQSEGEDIEKIQIFRSTIIPEIISEQNPSQLYLDTFGSEPHSEIMISEGSALVDDIVPNTKYFYMIRAKDKNGHFSNPSNIYRVEMVQEDGLIFPIIELYIPKIRKRGVKYRKVAKHLEIKPALLMTEPNWSADDDNNISWKIGARDDSIFSMRGDTNGRQFKIRLTSIDTGRKMEINVRFNKETNRVEAIDDRDIGE